MISHIEIATKFSDENILIIDFGSQYTQLIARRVREEGVFCQIIPYNKVSKYIINKGYTLSRRLTYLLPPVSERLAIAISQKRPGKHLFLRS